MMAPVRGRAWAVAVAFGLSLAGGDAAAQGGRMAFRTHAITDPQQGDLTVATIQVPVQWRVSQSVSWRYPDVSNPLRIFARAESPDGSAWVEFFPAEIFYWLQPVTAQVPYGGRSLGLIHAPGIAPQRAVQQFVVQPYRGKQPQMRVVNARPVDAGRLAAAFNQPPARGEGVGMRIAYLQNGRPVEEDVYAMLGAVNSIPYTGRQGTWYENQRGLLFVHALGANAGTLDSMYPLLTYIVGSIRIDPEWERRRQQVMQALAAEFQRQMQAGLAQIDAAGAASRAISANNDAMLSSMQFQRQAAAQRDAAMRAATAKRLVVRRRVFGLPARHRTDAGSVLGNVGPFLPESLSLDRRPGQLPQQQRRVVQPERRDRRRRELAADGARALMDDASSMRTGRRSSPGRSAFASTTRRSRSATACRRAGSRSATSRRCGSIGSRAVHSRRRSAGRS